MSPAEIDPLLDAYELTVARFLHMLTAEQRESLNDLLIDGFGIELRIHVRDTIPTIFYGYSDHEFKFTEMIRLAGADT